MLTRERELLAVDLGGVDVRKGVIGTVAVVLAVAVVALFVIVLILLWTSIYLILIARGVTAV